MYKLFLKIATRYLLKNKLYSFINIFGLAIGIASFVLIMLYVNYEHSYDKFKGSDHVYRVYMDYLEGDKYVPGDAEAYIASGPALKAEFPEIQDFVRFRRLNDLVVLRDNYPYDNIVGSLADSEYFDVLDHGLVKGDVETALKEPYSIVLSTLLAKKIFGDMDPIGKALKIAGDDTVSFTVTGVMDNSGRNTHIKNDLLVSFKTFYSWKVFEGDWKYTWNQNVYYTYLKLAENSDVQLLNQKVMNFRPKGFEFQEKHHLEPIEDIHLYSNKPFEAEANGSGSSVRLLAIIAFITLVLSWMNYMNLSSSKSLERAKEIGIRKVVGAQKTQLVLQFLLESALLNGIAVILSLLAAYLLLPSFNAFVEQDLGLDGKQLKGLLPYFGILVMGATLAAFYPAFILSRYNPAKALKGKVQSSRSGLTFRKGLIVCQFIATIALLTGTFVANKQIHYLKNRPIGANLNQIVALSGQVFDREKDSLFHQDINIFINELKNSPYVSNVTGASTYPGDDFLEINSSVGLTFPNGHTDEKHIWYHYAARPEYFEVMEMDFVAGEAFKETARGFSNNIVINEKMAHFMGIDDMQSLIGKTIRFGESDWPISGVVKDYNHFGMKSPVVPLIIRHYKETDNILVKFNEKALTSAGMDKALAEFNKIWLVIFPQSTYNYSFLDEQFEALYKKDRKFSRAFQIFTILAILIASMGLFGLTSYTVVQRKKEIGIRKVNGATIAQILSLLNKDFVKWVGLAFVMAVPISWYAMDQWLEGFAYKTSISWWIFALAGLTALAIALITVSWQSFQAAVANPVDSLRTE
ncbi:ABC transporter permease [Ulvibacterium sp.]|uniref:ABC transporter permease n=1 Tax=Ulvibacterium sp. TaxID=2665914 RepID=UPI003BA8780D